jgi:hypothetical protein
MKSRTDHTSFQLVAQPASAVAWPASSNTFCMLWSCKQVWQHTVHEESRRSHMLLTSSAARLSSGMAGKL